MSGLAFGALVRRCDHLIARIGWGNGDGKSNGGGISRIWGFLLGRSGGSDATGVRAGGALGESRPTEVAAARLAALVFATGALTYAEGLPGNFCPERVFADDVRTFAPDSVAFADDVRR